MSSTSELGQFIPVHYHYQMLLDEARVLGFQMAINSIVTPTSKVLELGGGTGILSSFASKIASEVICIELNPELVSKSRTFLANNNCKNVTVVEADATTYIPEEAVDFVICEMLHSALLREKQLSVIEAFKKNYLSKFEKLPVFIPATTLVAVQPVNQVFSFCGYKAEIPIFLAAGLQNTGTTEISDPYTYSVFHYHQALPQHFGVSQEFTAKVDGEVNAIRFITKNILAYLIEENSSVDWYNLYLTLPLPTPLKVKQGQTFKISFSYPAGGQLEDINKTLSAKIV
jgi:protein arginine N-methyltransferase 1